ncbi:protein lap1 [Dichotomopilus funicola]|uniref:Protein lap1 n=1 Tax=Dichotomopilus funicola TaxID=1934379 RepID=A0AAN6UV44_9PEZI|nr:protein lap1 [Dichotomopilus funicola]
MKPNLLPLLLLPFTTAITTPLPSLQITLTPLFSPSTLNITSLSITLLLNHTTSNPPNLTTPLLYLDLNHGLTPTQQYPTAFLTASDTLGPLSLISTDTNTSDATRTWFPADRAPQGPVTVQFTAVPRVVDKSTPSGPRVDLRGDEGGVVGMGTGFLALPPGEEDWSIDARWILPEGGADNGDGKGKVKAVSSLGEGLETVGVVGWPRTVVAKSYFAVGEELRRWPDWDDSSASSSSATRDGGGGDNGDVEEAADFHVYWLNTLPYDPSHISTIAQSMHLAIADFFIPNTTIPPFRVFWRHAPAGYGGAGGYNSFLLEWSDGTAAEQSEEQASFLLSHENIHEYALMYPSRQYDLWYREGVAQMYAVIAPYLAGAVDKAYLIRWLNNNMQAYYTGGMAGVPWQEVVDNYWTSVQNVKAPYGIGFAYLAQVQGLVSWSTGGAKGLDLIVRELYRRYKAGDTVQTEQFVEVLGSVLEGSLPAQQSINGMLNGTLIVPRVDGFVHLGLTLVRRDAELFELGFVSAQGKVTGFTAEKTRAEEAGLRVGDEIVSMWGAWLAGDSLDNMMEVVVRRDGKDETITYWPRSYEKVENWEWVDSEAV